MDKHSLRKEISSRRRAFASTAEAAALADDATRQIITGELFKNASVVLLYASLPDEISTAGLINAAYGSFTDSGTARRVILPVVEGDNLVLREYIPGKTVPGYRGIEEPSEECPVISPSEIDLAIIPGVAFTIDGKRLGRGRGYYDRLLPELKCPKIGLCFGCQIVDDIECDPWDIKMDGVVLLKRD